MRLTQIDRKEIVAVLQARSVTMKELAAAYGVSSPRISQIYKEETGRRFSELPDLSQNDKEELGSSLPLHMTSGTEDIEKQLKTQYASPMSRYRAWHTGERKMYPVLGLDWFDQKVLTDSNGVPAWYPMDLFVIMGSSGLRDRKRTPEYPEGQNIYAGDIIQFSIDLTNEKKKEIKDVVAFDPATGWFVVVWCDDDPVALHNDECKVIGTIQENPELLGSELQQIRALLKEYTFA